MAFRKSSVNKKIKFFLDEFKRTAPLNRAILFGSYASGTAGKWSDIDLAIISGSFEGKTMLQRLIMLGKLAWKTKTTEIEALGFTPREYKESTDLDLLSEIKAKGITVYGS